MVLGTVFPALVLLLVLLSSISWTAPLSHGLQVCLAVGCISGAVVFATHHFSSRLLVLVTLSGFTVIAVAHRLSAAHSRHDAKTSSRQTPPPADANAVMRAQRSILETGVRQTAPALEGLIAVDTPIPVVPPGAIQLNRLLHFFVAAITSVFAAEPWLLTRHTLATLILSLSWALAPHSSHERIHKTATRAMRWTVGHLADIGAIAIISILSFRSDQLFGQHEPHLLSYHHWGYFIGAAELVRQGGWLLWDVPSQYGFLNILLIAALPSHSVWQSLYLVNSSLIFLAACFLFLILRSLRSGVLNYGFSLAVTLATAFLLPGILFVGPQIYPSIGAFRFFWCYALLAVLLWEFRASLLNKPKKHIMWVGCVCWVIGTLWSAESAAYAAGIWVPAYVLISLRKAGILGQDPWRAKTALPQIAAWLLLPFLLLTLTLAGIAAYYLFFLGHIPDWRAFFEYSLAFRSGSVTAASAALDPEGPIWSHFIVFCVVSTAVVSLVRRGFAEALSLAAGAWAALWTTTSYYIVRGDNATYLCLLPIVCTVLGLMLYIFKRYRMNDHGTALLRTSLAAFLCVVVLIAFKNTNQIISLARRIQTFNPAIERQLPIMNESMSSLLDAAHVNAGDPIVYVDTTLDMLPVRLSRTDGATPRTTMGPSWIPIRPFSGSMPPTISEDRMRLYVSRFIARHPMSGYLLIRIDLKALPWGIHSPNWLFEQLQLTHRAYLIRANADYQLIWFQRRRL
jgi:hypothetical protein